MNILLITPYYAPDLGPSAPLFTMLCEDMARLGHKLNIITAVPHFPSGIVASSYRGKFINSSIENGNRVIRVWVPSGDRANLFHRTCAFLIFQLEAAFCCLLMRFDKVIISNPCLETWLPFFVAVLKRKPVLYCVWDIYPEILIKTKIFNQKSIISLIRIFEDFCLRHAKKIHVFVDEAADLLVKEHNVDCKKVFVMAPWVDTQWLQPRIKNNTLCGKDIGGKFTVLYAGNIGYSQGLTSVLDAAKILQKDADCLFIFIGDGSEKNALVEKAEKEKIDNVLFLPFQPRENLPDVLSAADVCLISLRPEVTEESIPSKAFPIMASGKPILSFTDPKSGLWKLVEVSQAGINVPSQRIDQLVRTINGLVHDKELLIKLGENARKYAIKNLDRYAAAQNFSVHLSQMD